MQQYTKQIQKHSLEYILKGLQNNETRMIEKGLVAYNSYKFDLDGMVDLFQLSTDYCDKVGADQMKLIEYCIQNKDDAQQIDLSRVQQEMTGQWKQHNKYLISTLKISGQNTNGIEWSSFNETMERKCYCGLSSQGVQCDYCKTSQDGYDKDTVFVFNVKNINSLAINRLSLLKNHQGVLQFELRNYWLTYDDSGLQDGKMIKDLLVKAEMFTKVKNQKYNTRVNNLLNSVKSLISQECDLVKYKHQIQELVNQLNKYYNQDDMKSMRDTFISTLKLHGLFKEESTEDLIRYLKM